MTSKNIKKQRDKWYDSTDKDELWGVNLDPHDELDELFVWSRIRALDFLKGIIWKIKR